MIIEIAGDVRSTDAAAAAPGAPFLSAAGDDALQAGYKQEGCSRQGRITVGGGLGGD